jgi:hypothetical protein
MDGPVVTAARQALDRQDVRLILPYVKATGEAEVKTAFERAQGARNGNPAVNEVADLYFFDTVVRVHRAGEGAPYTGLKPAGLSEGPVIPVAERAIETGDASELIALLTEKVRSEIEHRFHEVMERKPHASESVEAGREYVEAMLGLQVWSHKVFGCLEGGAHDEPTGETHNHG